MERIEGIILGKKSYRESDELIWILSRKYGVISGIAKGSKGKIRKKQQAIQIYQQYYIDMLYREGLSIFYTFENQQKMEIIAGEKVLPLFLYGSQIAELLQYLAPKASVGIYNETAYLFAHLSEFKHPALAIIYLYQKLFSLTGLSVQLHCCARCGSTKNIMRFSFDYIGLLCRECFMHHQDKDIKNIETVKLLSRFSRIKREQLLNLELEDEQIKQLLWFWEYLYEQYGGIRLKSSRVRERLDEDERKT